MSTLSCGVVEIQHRSRLLSLGHFCYRIPVRMGAISSYYYTPMPSDASLVRAINAAGKRELSEMLAKVAPDFLKSSLGRAVVDSYLLEHAKQPSIVELLDKYK